MPLVSVVIPAYNRSRSIETAVRSVLAQTYQDFEIIIVDDGSKDGTPAVLETLARLDQRIKYICHPVNRGAQAARNTAIRASQGKWIAFLDSDDQWLPESLEVRLRLTNSVHVIHSECLTLDANGKLERFRTPAMAGRVYKALLQKPGPTFPSLLVSKGALVRIDYLDEAVVAYQEWDTSIRLARYYQFGFVPEPTFIYDRSQADYSLSGNCVRNAVGYEQIVRKHHWPIVRQLGPKALAAHYQSASRLYSLGNDSDNARRCARQAFLVWPFQPRTILARIRRSVKMF